MLKIHFKREENSCQNIFDNLIGLYYLGIFSQEIIYFYLIFGILLVEDENDTQSLYLLSKMIERGLGFKKDFMLSHIILKKI
jgi:hypothetical protein